MCLSLRLLENWNCYVQWKACFKFWYILPSRKDTSHSSTQSQCFSYFAYCQNTMSFNLMSEKLYLFVHWLWTVLIANELKWLLHSLWKFPFGNHLQESISCLLQWLCHMTNNHQNQWHQRMIIYLAHSPGLACDFSGLSLLIHLWSAACWRAGWLLPAQGWHWRGWQLWLSSAHHVSCEHVFREKADKLDRE